MRPTFILTIFSICLLLSSCQHRARGPHPLSAADSARRAAAIADRQRLKALENIHEDIEGPLDTTSGNGEVAKGSKYRNSTLDDSTAAIVSSFERLSTKLKTAQEDSTTRYGVLISRFKTIDTEGKYLSATYTGMGRLLTFHSEVTIDDKHQKRYDFYFDKGKLRYLNEQLTYTIADADEEQQELSTSDSYYMSGNTLLYCYRDEGTNSQKKGHVNLMTLTRYALKGDTRGHVARLYAQFVKDYQVLMKQSMERMIYTPPAFVPSPDPPPEKPLPKRGQIPIVFSE